MKTIKNVWNQNPNMRISCRWFKTAVSQRKVASKSQTRKESKPRNLGIVWGNICWFPKRSSGDSAVPACCHQWHSLCAVTFGHFSSHCSSTELLRHLLELLQQVYYSYITNDNQQKKEKKFNLKQLSYLTLRII